AVLIGLNYLFATESAVLAFNFGEATLPARLFARATGAAVLAIGVITLLSVGDTGSPGLPAPVVRHIRAPAARLFADFSEGFERNAILWVTVVIHVGVIVAFGYLLSASSRLADARSEVSLKPALLRCMDFGGYFRGEHAKRHLTPSPTIGATPDGRQCLFRR